MTWKEFKRKGTTMARPYIPGENLYNISVSKEDYPPKLGDMVARNQYNTEDQWLIAAEYFDKNYEEVE
jgi:hypothetical protein